MAQTEESHQDLLSMMVCAISCKYCMLQQCVNCPDDIVMYYLESQFKDSNEDITFVQWITADRAEMIYPTLLVNDYIPEIACY